MTDTERTALIKTIRTIDYEKVYGDDEIHDMSDDKLLACLQEVAEQLAEDERCWWKELAKSDHIIRTLKRIIRRREVKAALEEKENENG